MHFPEIGGGRGTSGELSFDQQAQQTDRHLTHTIQRLCGERLSSHQNSAKRLSHHRDGNWRTRFVSVGGCIARCRLWVAAGITGSLKMAEAIASPFKFENSIIHCVAHTGALGMNNRGRDQVEQDWSKLKAALKFRR